MVISEVHLLGDDQHFRLGIDIFLNNLQRSLESSIANKSSLVVPDVH